MGYEGFPFIIGWELTLKCNMKCKHCGSSAGPTRDNELDLEESLAICDQFRDLLVKEVNFTGGEPLMCTYWEELADYLYHLGIDTKILTNGWLLDEDMIARIKAAHISGLGISLDGMKNTHDNIRRRKGLFDRVVKGIDIANQAGLPVTIITTANKLNIPELPEMGRLLVTSGVKCWQIQPIFTLGRAKEGSALQIDKSDYLALGEFISKWTPIYAKEGMELSPGDSYGYFTSYDTRTPEWRGCPAGLFSCGITSDGMVKGCLSMPNELIEGDLRKADLWDIWFHPDSFAYTRNFSLRDMGSYCAGCDKQDQCRGGCTAMSYGCTECFHNDPFCFYRFEREKEAVA